MASSVPPTSDVATLLALSATATLIAASAEIANDDQASDAECSMLLHA